MAQGKIHTAGQVTRSGIFGPTLCGKTTLAAALAESTFRNHKRACFVLDPHLEKWPEHCKVTDNEEKFWPDIWKANDSLIIVEEASATLRREREFVPVFTRLRHLGHDLIVIGHSGADLLPVQRQQFTVLYLFRQPESAAKIWAETFADDRIYEATTLRQFEFLHVEMFQPPKRSILKL